MTSETPAALESEQAASAQAEGASGAYYTAAMQDAEAMDAATAAEEAVPQRAVSDRKIIYNTHIDLVVEDYQDFESNIPLLVEEHGGFVSNSQTNRRYSDRQTGTWTVRVPVDQYSEFIRDVAALGFAESRREDAQDVTEEFVDVQARIKNKRELESRIIQLLEDRTGKLSDVLEIERELSRVREEIERMEGRLRYLAERSSLATVTIDCREQQEYAPAEAPTFASRVTRTWHGSLGALMTTGQKLVIGFVAAAPWLIAIGIPAGLVMAGYRRIRRR